MMSVDTNRVAARGDLAGHSRVSQNLFTRQEECCGRVELLEHVEDSRCALRMRSVVEGECDAFQLLEVSLHSEQVGHRFRCDRCPWQRPNRHRSHSHSGRRSHEPYSDVRAGG